MIELLALAPEDGWAYVRTEKGIRLLRPPYINGTSSFVEEHTVEKAVCTHGFTAMTEHFADWGRLIDFLNQRVVESRQAHGQTIPEPGAMGQDMLKMAPPDVLITFLDRVERELLPQHQWSHAESLLLAMIRLPTVRQDAELHERATTLLSILLHDRDNFERARCRLAAGNVDFDTNFPKAIERYGRDALIQYGEEICQRAGILTFA